MNILLRPAHVLAKACGYEPLYSVGMTLLFYLMVNHLEAVIERVIFGESFEHPLDILVASVFVAYAGYTTFLCSEKESGDEL